MNLIPDEELKSQGTINLAPMVDFLFLIIAVFAVLAVTRAALFDTEVKLVKLNPVKEESSVSGVNHDFIVNLSIAENGQYKWIAEADEYVIENLSAVQKELVKQQEMGILPEDKSRTKVLLHIDRNAKWDPIAQMIFAVREIGYQIHPVYEPMDEKVAL